MVEISHKYIFFHSYANKIMDLTSSSDIFKRPDKAPSKLIK